jgi:hypothetical protein
MSTADAPHDVDVADLPAMATESAEPDLVDCMRRLSVGSSTSSFSVVSEVHSVQSLDSDGSVNGGVAVNPPSIEVLETCLEALTVANAGLEEAITQEEEESSDDTAKSTTAATPDDSDPTTSNRDVAPSTPSPYWLQFPTFTPIPTSTFKSELSRLAKHCNWTKKEKRKQQVKALAAEITHHYGVHQDKLDRWRQLCEDVGIDVVPTSITGCRKATSPVLVNLYNVIDHRRNPNEVKILRFKSYGEFVRYTRRGRTFPRECAKEDGFIKVFLRKM